MSRIFLSPSTLNLFRDCPRCFWYEKNDKRNKRPRGIFPSLPGGMDRAIKEYCDKWRTTGKLPPELKGKFEGKLLGDQSLLKKWRNWRTTDLRYICKETGATLSGALDDCIITSQGHIPFDYKTKGSLRTNEELTADTLKYYQTQANSYCLMLGSSGYKAINKTYFWYFMPQEVGQEGVIQFKTELVTIDTNPENVKELIISAAETMLLPEPPDSSPECEYCSMVEGRSENKKE